MMVFWVGGIESLDLIGVAPAGKGRLNLILPVGYQGIATLWLKGL